MVAWAKLKETASGIETHSLVAHSADTGAVMERLLAGPVIADRLARLAGLPELNPTTRARLSLLAAIHDAGKANRGFWNRGAKEGGASRDKAFKAGHVGPVVNLMHPTNIGGCKNLPRSPRLFVDALGLDRLFRWTGGERKGLAPLLDAVLMHHGRLPDCGPIDDRLWQSSGTYDPATELDRIGSSLESWFPDAFAGESMPLPVEKRFLHAFAGLVMLADWIASDESCFTFDAEPDPNRIAFARKRADEAIRRFQLDPAASRAPLRLLTDLMSSIIGQGRTPRPAQAAMASVRTKPGSIIVIEAETGSGKTEAALLHFINLFRAGQVDGLYFALPTRAAAVQIHRRISEALKNLLGDAAPATILAVPGYLRVDDHDGLKLPDFAVQWPDRMDDRQRDSAWAAEHPKRYLAAAIAVGTVDQLMLGALNVRHAHLRSGPMLRQLLVIDEVHASDHYMERVVRHLLEQHREAGGHALLMSATLGTAARMRLMGADARTVANDPRPVEALAALPYPAIHAQGAEVPALPAPSGAAKEIAVELIDVDDANRALAERSFAAALSGARVLVIRNKVDDAKETAAIVAELAASHDRPDLTFRCMGIATVHHGRFAPSDRRLLDAALEQALGEESTKPVVCVATQTAEQSLDIDADILLTDLCPADVLLQRIGRLHRHRRKHRPEGCVGARAVILAPSEERLAKMLASDGSVRGRLLGLGKVYPNLVGLASTRRTLQELGTIQVPRHNRLLVERATHMPFLSGLAGELGHSWERHYANITGVMAARSQWAQQNLLQFEDSIAPPIDLEAKIATRLGIDNRAVHFDQPVTGPFGSPVSDLTLPGWMAKGVDLEAKPEIIEAVPVGFSFVLDKKTFLYAQWGLQLNAS